MLLGVAQSRPSCGITFTLIMGYVRSEPSPRGPYVWVHPSPFSFCGTRPCPMFALPNQCRAFSLSSLEIVFALAVKDCSFRAMSGCSLFCMRWLLKLGLFCRHIQHVYRMEVWREALVRWYPCPHVSLRIRTSRGLSSGRSCSHPASGFLVSDPCFGSTLKW